MRQSLHFHGDGRWRNDIFQEKENTTNHPRRIDGEINNGQAHYKHKDFVRFGPQKLFQWGQDNYPKLSNDDTSNTNNPPPAPQGDSTTHHKEEEEYIDAMDKPAKTT